VRYPLGTAGLVVIDKSHLASRNNDQAGVTVKRCSLGTRNHPDESFLDELT
jgi:hypothetical protein